MTFQKDTKANLMGPMLAKFGKIEQQNKIVTINYKPLYKIGIHESTHTHTHN